MEILHKIDFAKSELIPVIVQDYISKEILMQAYMNKEALELTLKTGYMHYFSRSRNTIWKKGETSGNVQKVISLYTDCDGDSILALVEQKGYACHTGNKTCFYEKIFDFQIEDDKKVNIAEVLNQLMMTINKRRNEKTDGSYTVYLFEKGIDKILKKVGEEASEVIIGSKNGKIDEIRYEIADLIYHLSVLLSYYEMKWEDIGFELLKRKK